MHKNSTSRPGSGMVAGVSQASQATADPSAVSALSIPSRDLEFGMRNEDTRVLQKLLNAHEFTVSTSGGGSPGRETTYFGPATRSALVRLQKAHNIKPALGYFGPITRRILQQLQSS